MTVETAELTDLAPSEAAQVLLRTADEVWLAELQRSLDRQRARAGFDRVLAVWNLNQSDAAALFGVTRQAIAKWRTGGFRRVGSKRWPIFRPPPTCSSAISNATVFQPWCAAVRHNLAVGHCSISWTRAAPVTSFSRAARCSGSATRTSAAARSSPRAGSGTGSRRPTGSILSTRALPP